MTHATLTGTWIGRYDQPGAAPVAFEATLRQTGSLIRGETTEPNGFRPDMGPVLQAMLDGVRSGAGLWFVKRYAGFDQGDDPRYDGTVNADLTRISGQWRFRRQATITGRFVMMRPPLASARVGRRLAQPVEAGP